MATLAGVGVEHMGLAEFAQQLPQKGKGEGETLGYGKNNKTRHLDLERSEFKSTCVQ